MNLQSVLTQWLCVASLVFLSALAPLQAKEAALLAEDPLVEKRLIHISEELRCMVCQNESLASSRAELANDLREEVRKLIREDRSDSQIKEYLVTRYGDFVLYRPPLQSRTLLLWLGPFLLLAWALWVVTRRMGKRGHGAPAPLSPQEAARAAQLLSDRGQP